MRSSSGTVGHEPDPTVVTVRVLPRAHTDTGCPSSLSTSRALPGFEGSPGDPGSRSGGGELHPDATAQTRQTTKPTRKRRRTPLASASTVAGMRGCYPGTTPRLDHPLGSSRFRISGQSRRCSRWSTLGTSPRFARSSPEACPEVQCRCVSECPFRELRGHRAPQDRSIALCSPGISTVTTAGKGNCSQNATAEACGSIAPVDINHAVRTMPCVPMTRCGAS